MLQMAVAGHSASAYWVLVRVFEAAHRSEIGSRDSPNHPGLHSPAVLPSHLAAAMARLTRVIPSSQWPNRIRILVAVLAQLVQRACVA